MVKWTILHRVRYPPFDDKRIKPESAPIFEEVVESNLSSSQIVKRLPPYKIRSREGWLIERVIQDDEGKHYETMTDKRDDDSPFVELIHQQREGWYLLPNNLHRYSRNMINVAVIFSFIDIGLSFFGTHTKWNWNPKFWDNKYPNRSTGLSYSEYNCCTGFNVTNRLTDHSKFHRFETPTRFL